MIVELKICTWKTYRRIYLNVQTNALYAGRVLVMCGTVWMHLFLLRPPSWSRCSGRPAQWQRPNGPRRRQAQAQAELRLCRPVSCSSASVSVAHSQYFAERTTLCGVAAVSLAGFSQQPREFATSLLEETGPIRLPAALFLSLSPASADFLALTGLSLRRLGWTGRARRFLGQRSEGSGNKSRQIHVRAVQAFKQFPALSGGSELSPQDVEHHECTSPCQWFWRVGLRAV